MVVLEGHNMIGVNSPNQYLPPDYLSPLPTTMDSKTSPLALLVKTCSQIGTDIPPKFTSSHSLHPSPPLSSSDSNESASSIVVGAQKRKASTSSDSGGGNSIRSSNSDSYDSRPRSSGSSGGNGWERSAKQPRLSNQSNVSPTGKTSPKHLVIAHNNNNEPAQHHHSHHSHSHKIRKLSGQSVSSESSDKNRSVKSSSTGGSSANVIVPQGKTSASSNTSSRSPNLEKSVKTDSSGGSSKHTTSPKPPPTSAASSHQNEKGQSPIIRSGLEVLQGRDVQRSSLPFGFPGFENPAFRLPHHLGYPAMLGYPSAANNPYLAYSRLKAGAGGPAGCPDPYCSGCTGLQVGGMPPGGPSAMSGLMAAASAAAQGGGVQAVCPAGCAQCDHQKIPLHYPMSGFPPGLSHAALSAAAAAYHPHAAAAAAMMQHQQAAAIAVAKQQQSAHAASQKPFTCSWVNGVDGNLCSERYASAESLLSHLRTHTNSTTNAQHHPSGVPPEASVASQYPAPPPTSIYSSALFNSQAMAAAAAAMQRAAPYPTPPLSPLSAARYHATIAAYGKPGLGQIPPPPQLGGMSLYPSPYSLYNRIG